MKPRRRASISPLPLLGALLILAMSAAPAVAGVVFSDDFEDGTVNSAVFTPVGNATVTEENGKLVIRTFGVGDGVEIKIPSNTRCVSLQTEIPEVEFDQFEAFGVAAMFTDTDGNEILGVAAELLRPFWNRCQVTFKFGDQRQTEGFWG